MAEKARSEEIDTALATAKILAEKKKAQYKGKSPRERIRGMAHWVKETEKVVNLLMQIGQGRYFSAYLALWYDLEKVLEIPRRWPRDPIPPKTRQAIIEECTQTCQYCGKRGNTTQGPDGNPWHIDHIEPWVSGGSNDRSNLTLACATCNMKKKTRPAEQFAT